MFNNATVHSSSLAEAIPRVLDLVVSTGKTAIVRGEVNREVLGADIAITNPRNRIPAVPGRRSPLAFCIIEFLWYCAQRVDLDPLEVYAPNISSFYWGERRVTGSAYGKQIFETKTTSSQWANIVALLRVDPGSKRAFMAVYNPDTVKTLTADNHDVACTTGFQVLVRDGALHWITNMRANDAYRGFVSDVFSFTSFHELLASTLDLPLGHYLHRPMSLHTFPEDEDNIDVIVRSWRTAGRRTEPPPVPPRLHYASFWKHLHTFWSIHDSAQETAAWPRLADLADLDDPWWTWVGATLSTHHVRSAP